MPVSYSGTAITWPDNSTTTSGWTGFKNRILNGQMMIDQRNAGASISAGDGSYAVDRFLMYHASGSGSKGNIQQNQGAVTPPAGFVNYLGFTTTSAYSVGSGDGYAFQQRIEGLNCADLGWGTANAATVTLSFWVRSSLTGTFGGSVVNGGANYSYPFSYTISAANTWEQKTITIAGPTSGTWLTTNGVGMYLSFSIGTGTTYSGTAGSWSGTRYWSTTGATSVVGTNGATFYITGVQLERGSTASSFDYRPYGTELALCQRYYEKSFDITTAPANTIQATTGGAAVALSTGALRTQPITFQVAKRSNSVTVTFYNATQPASPTASQWTWYTGSAWVSSTGTVVTDALVTTNGFSVNMTVSGATTGYAYLYTGNWAVSAEL
jgi:hypothetical protein